MKAKIGPAEIHFALKTKQISVLTNLLQSGADPDSIYRGVTPLGVATADLNLPFVTILLQAGADPDLRSKGSNDRLEPPIVTACRLRSEVLVKTLLSYGANVNSTDFYGHTPLWVSTKEQQPGLLGLLLNSGAQVHQKDPEWNWGECPLYLATKYLGYRGRHSLARILLSAGVDPMKTDRKGRGAFYWCFKNKDYQLLSFMIELYNPICWSLLVNSVIEDFLTESPGEFQEYFKDEFLNPPSLQRLCRINIRKCLEVNPEFTNMFVSVPKLPLPLYLKRFLLFHEDIQTEKTSKTCDL